MGRKKDGIIGGMIRNMLYRGIIEATKDPATGKVDPYAAAGAALGSGKVKNLRHYMQLGAQLGAAGAFDPEPASSEKISFSADNDMLGETADIFGNDCEISSLYSDADDYAWRENCEDGTEHCIFPEDYETEEEYEEALMEAKYEWRLFCEDGSEYDLDPEDYETEEEYNEDLEELRAIWEETDEEE